MESIDRAAILEKAKQIIEKRQVIDGVPENSFPAMAKAWSAYLMARGADVDLDALDVMVMMAIFKMIRAGGCVGGLDDYIDGCAYQSLAGQRFVDVGKLPPLSSK